MKDKAEKFFTVLLVSIALTAFLLSYLFGFGAASAERNAVREVNCTSLRLDMACEATVYAVQTAAPAPQCDESLWRHIYHAKRLVVQQACVTVDGAWQDASHGRTADDCRHEKDGDGHCWLKLDAGQAPPNGASYLNAENVSKQDGNLVIEPICVYRVTQADAKASCANWHQSFSAPKIGAHVRVTGAWVLDTEHGHMEIHPISKIEVLKEDK